ncbi:MAG: HNH endonuclease [Candidatus Poribacteria bacterium]|nr:HNH endonuclease [Candidatus Poribacteria bacterium]
MAKTVDDFILEFFMKHPGEEFEPSDVVDWVTPRYEKERGKTPRDVPRAIRRLAQKGRLTKVRYGIYKYDRTHDHEVELQDFSEADKQAIFERDNYRCVVCGLSEEDGVKIAADHKIPIDRGGTNDIENGQTLCYQHNSIKKNYSQTEAGKRYFIKIYETAVKNEDEKMIAFCESVFDAYDKHNMNGHIPRPDTED